MAANNDKVRQEASDLVKDVESSLQIARCGLNRLFQEYKLGSFRELSLEVTPSIDRAAAYARNIPSEINDKYPPAITGKDNSPLSDNPEATSPQKP